METLVERLFGEEKKHLASRLPEEVAHYLHEVDRDEKFDVDEFFRRISEREVLDLPVSVHHARAVLDVVREAVTPGQWDSLLHEPRAMGKEGQLGIVDAALLGLDS